MIREEIKNIISDAILSLQKEGKLPEFEVPEILVERPGQKVNGDYSTSIPLKISVAAKKTPMEIADLLAEKLNINKGKIFEKVEVASPGFVNFWLEENVFIDNVKEIIKKRKDFGKGGELKNKKLIIDYTDPNILKEFHIGHLMSNIIGESLSRIFEFQGAKVKRLCYQSDVGISVAKAVWGMIQMKNNESFPKDSSPLSARIKQLNMAYAFGSQAYEDEGNDKKEIISLNKKIFERSDPEINKLYDKGKKWSLEYFAEIYIKLGTKFDYFILESQVSDLGKKIVEKGLKDGIFEKSDGAVVFKGEKYGFHTRVFINSEGLPTYEAKDLGLAQIKYKKYPYDLSFIITGNEVNEYFNVMLRAMKETAPELAEKTKHIGHGMLRLPEGKMSSRTGKVITGEFLLGKTEEMVMEKIKNRGLVENEKKSITQKVAVGAVKYSILKQTIGKDVIYSFDKSISFEGDSGPYLQYSYVRAKSVLKKAKVEGIKSSFKNLTDKITLLEKTMYYFPDIVEKAGRSYEPHHILLYLTELAGAFNAYYAENKIAEKSDKSAPYKVAITEAFSIIMEIGMHLLGIDLLEKM